MVDRQPRVVVALVSVAALVVVLAGIAEFRSVIGPSFLALVLAVTLDPLRGALRRRGAPNWAATAGLLLTTYAIFLALVTALALSVSQLALLIPRYSPRFDDLAVQAGSLLEPLGVTVDQITGFVASIDLSTLAGQLRPVVGGATSAVSALILILILVGFLEIEAVAFERRLSTAPAHPELVAALGAFAHRTQRYMAVTSVFGFVIAVLDVALLFAMGIPAPLVWGLLSFVTNYIPNVGFLIGVAPPAILALLQGGIWPMLVVIVAYSVINFVGQSLIQPKVVGDAVQLSPTVTFLSFIFWAVVLGPLGAFLAVPLTLFAKAILIDANPDARWLGAFIGDEDVAKQAFGAPGRVSVPSPDTTPAAGYGDTMSRSGQERGLHGSRECPPVEGDRVP